MMATMETLIMGAAGAGGAGVVVGITIMITTVTGMTALL